MKRWDKGSELRITSLRSKRFFCSCPSFLDEPREETLATQARGSRKGYLREYFFFFFAAIHPTFKHAPRKESTIKRSVDDLELFDDQRRKSARII